MSVVDDSSATIEPGAGVEDTGVKPTPEERKLFRLRRRQAKNEERRSVERSHSRFRRNARFLLRWLGSGPVSLTFAVLIAVFYLVTIPIGRPGLEDYVTVGLGHPWWTFFTSVFWTTDALHAALNILMLLTLGVALERIIKPQWYLLVGTITLWLGALLAFGAANWIAVVDPVWGELLKTQDVAGVADALAGIAMATSVKVSVAWRRRIQITFITILLVMLGFAGTLDSLATLFSGLIGLGIGMILWRKERATEKVPGTRREGRILISLIVAGVVVGVLVSLSSPQSMGALSALRFQFVSNDMTAENIAAVCAMTGLEGQCAHYTYLLQSSGFGSKLLVLMPLVAQLVLAWGLRGGRRAAFWGTILLQALTASIAVFHMVVVGSAVKGWSEAALLMGFNENGTPTARFIVPIVVPLLLILVVSVNSKLFTIKATPGTYRRFWGQFTLLTGATLLVSVLLGIMFRGYLDAARAVGIVILDFFIRMLPSSMLSIVSPQAVVENRAMMVILEWAPIVPWIGLCLLLLHSFRQRTLPNAISRERYLDLVRSTNAGTMGWISTWEGNLYWGSENLDAGIAYRAHGGVALTVTDPAATAEQLPSVIKEFTDFCVEQDLTPAFYSVHSPVAEVTDKWGWPRLQVAEETTLVLPQLAFKGKSFQDVRTALNRATKEGIRPVWTTWSECPLTYQRQIRDISDQWVSDKPLPEMGFTLGGVPELDDPEVRILLAVDQDDQVQGATSWMPIYDRGDIIGWTLDFMRRREGGFRPVMEYLIASAALWAQEEQYEVLSLSGAPLAKAKPANASEAEKTASSARALDSLLDVLGGALEPVYGFRSLLRFKAKFQPEYFPVYLTIPDLSALGTVGLAVSHAYLPTLSVWDAVHVAQSIKSSN